MSFEEIPFCDEFHPTKEEMQNFQAYLTKCESKAKSGIIKVIPPLKWKARKDDYSKIDFTIPHPIEQIINGNKGIYDLIYIQREAKLLSKYRKAALENEKVIEKKNDSEIEKLFWQTIKFSPPVYGADISGTIFDKNVPWNLSELDSILKKGLDKDILGVTTPYLYIGAWKTLFAWHKEDMDLYSINYLHFGKPKCWYGIPPDQSAKFDEFAKKSFPESFKICPEFLRHKTFLINPVLVKNNNISVHKAVQHPGEFIITFAKSYHSGFNMGFNCAEAVNFALNKWISIGKYAKSCKCDKDSVTIDLNFFCDNLKHKKSLILKNKTEKSVKKSKKKKAKKVESLNNRITKNYNRKLLKKKKIAKFNNSHNKSCKYVHSTKKQSNRLKLII